MKLSLNPGDSLKIPALDPGSSRPGEQALSLAVAVISYNTRDHLQACLASVAAEAPSEVVIVDNASSDGSGAMVQAQFPQFRLLANQTNPGYGTAANQAITCCRSKYVLLLNSDTRLQPGSLRALNAYLERHPQAGLVGPRLANPDGTLQASCFPFPTPLYTFLIESILGVWLSRMPLFRDFYLPAWSHDRSRRVPWVLGAALAIRREAFEAVGRFDESFFMYFEEVDLCYRLHTAGWQVHFAPVTTVTHIREASTAQHRAAMRVQLYASLAHFYRRHYPGTWRRWQLRLIISALMLRNIIRDRVGLRGAERARLAEDVTIWKQVLFEQWKGVAVRA